MSELGGDMIKACSKFHMSEYGVMMMFQDTLLNY